MMLPDAILTLESIDVVYPAQRSWLTQVYRGLWPVRASYRKPMRPRASIYFASVIYRRVESPRSR